MPPLPSRPSLAHLHPLAPLPPLPVDAVLPQALELLAHTPRLVLEAAPGAGKTTRVPLALLAAPWLAGASGGNAENGGKEGSKKTGDNGTGGKEAGGPANGNRIIMLEPRRLATRAAARHMSALLGEKTGQTVGYITAQDKKFCKNSRILVVTEGVLTRMLQDDPMLEGVGCLIFDEFHERSLHADLGLALSLDCQSALRPDLRLLVMSATLDSPALSALLGNCPVLKVEGRSFPVSTRYLPPANPNLSCEDRAVAATLQALREEAGSILVFLPGSGEIRRAAEKLEAALAGTNLPRPQNTPEKILICPLYGDLGAEAQDAAVAPPPPGTRKVVLSTNIAESSLTIEGVRIVIDTGLERRQQVEAALGMNRLVTRRISRASADQRRGRAGRTEPGLCLRLWAEQEQAALRPQSRPEIMEADLASFCLELALWGLPARETPPQGLALLDAPPQPAWAAARALLRDLRAIDAAEQTTGQSGNQTKKPAENQTERPAGNLAENQAENRPAGQWTGQWNGQWTDQWAGRPTARGRAMATLPLHPRLAHMVLEGKALGLGPLACALAALFTERDPLPSGSADIRLRLNLLAGKAQHASSALLRRIQEQARTIAARSGINLKEEAKTLTTEALATANARAASGLAGVAAKADAAAQPGLLLALAWPDRLALRRAPGSYLMANGRGAVLPQGDPLQAADCLAVAALDAANADARIHLAAPLPRELLEELFADRIQEEERLSWDAARQAVSARRLRRLSALTLAEAPLPNPNPLQVKTALLQGLQDLPLSALPWSKELTAWRERVIFVRQALTAPAPSASAQKNETPSTGTEKTGAAGKTAENSCQDGNHSQSGNSSLNGNNGIGENTGLANEVILANEVDLANEVTLANVVNDSPAKNQWPDLSDAALRQTLPEWLGPWLDGIDRLSAITPDLLSQALHNLLPWPLPRQLDALAPTHFDAPSGSSIAIDYSDPQNGPLLAVKLQELFGLAATPTVLEGRIPMLVHLLSPAGRPVQVTRDLTGFWQNGYPAVRAELRGRYPKHPWPDNPMTATPTRHTKKRQEALEKS